MPQDILFLPYWTLPQEIDEANSYWKRDAISHPLNQVLLNHDPAVQSFIFDHLQQQGQEQEQEQEEQEEKKEHHLDINVGIIKSLLIL